MNPSPPLFQDRQEAGRRLIPAVKSAVSGPAVVVGLACGGVPVAARIARALGAPLDVVAVRKIGHPLEPEYGLGAVAPGGPPYLRGHDGVGEPQLVAAIRAAVARAADLEARLRGGRPVAPLDGAEVVLVDDGLATGGTMVAAARWARAHGARRVVVAVPVASAEGAALARGEADALACPHVLADLGCVGLWYGAFPQVQEDEVRAVLDAAADANPLAAGARP